MLTQFFFSLLILVSVVLSTIAQVLLKFGATQNFLNLYLLGGILTYGLGAVSYILALGKLNLSVAYPVLVGLTVVATTMASAIIFREKISTANWLGVGLILSGVYALAFNNAS